MLLLFLQKHPQVISLLLFQKILFAYTMPSKAKVSIFHFLLRRLHTVANLSLREQGYYRQLPPMFIARYKIALAKMLGIC